MRSNALYLKTIIRNTRRICNIKEQEQNPRKRNVTILICKNTSCDPNARTTNKRDEQNWEVWPALLSSSDVWTSTLNIGFSHRTQCVYKSTLCNVSMWLRWVFFILIQKMPLALHTYKNKAQKCNYICIGIQGNGIRTEEKFVCSDDLIISPLKRYKTKIQLYVDISIAVNGDAVVFVMNFCMFYVHWMRHDFDHICHSVQSTFSNVNCVTPCSVDISAKNAWARRIYGEGSFSALEMCSSLFYCDTGRIVDLPNSSVFV